MQVKILQSHNDMSLENKINALLAEFEEVGNKVLKMDFQHTYMIGQYSQPSYAVMITYEEVKNV